MVEPWDDSFETVLRPHLMLLEPGMPIAADLDLREAGLDSLTLIEVLIAIETTYEIEFPDALLTGETFRTPGTLWTAISTIRDVPTGQAAS